MRSGRLCPCGTANTLGSPAAVQADDIKKVADYVAQLRRVGKGHGECTFLAHVCALSAASAAPLRRSWACLEPPRGRRPWREPLARLCPVNAVREGTPPCPPTQ